MPYQSEHPVIQLCWIDGEKHPYSLECSLHPVWVRYKDRLPEEFNQYLFPTEGKKVKFRNEHEAIQVSDKIELAMSAYIVKALNEHNEDCGVNQST